MSEAWVVVAVEWKEKKVLEVELVTDPRKVRRRELRMIRKHYAEDEFGNEIGRLGVAVERVEVPE